MQFMFSRKSGIVLAALLGVQLILPASGWALTGRDVALKADQVDTSRTSDMSMAMIIKRGDQQLVRFMNMKKKKFPDSEKQHIKKKAGSKSYSRLWRKCRSFRVA